MSNLSNNASLGSSKQHSMLHSFFQKSLMVFVVILLAGYVQTLGAAENGNKQNSLNPAVKVGDGKVVGLDNFYNNEWKTDKDGKKVPFHYIWEDTENSGYSMLGKIINDLGAATTEIHEAPTPEDLKKVSIYFIVDPDTKKETDNPNYISEPAIKNITEWVNDGGVLILFANDSANCEFDHLNMLSEKFGIHFNKDFRNPVFGTKFEMGMFNKFPDHPIFKDVKQIYLKEICTLKLSGDAKPIFTDKGDVIMAGAQYGKGFVFALGDPWVYNEYIGHSRLPKDYENDKAAKNLFEWLLGKAQKVK